MALKSLPIELVVDGATVVLIGAGEEIARKIPRLENAGAQIELYPHGPIHDDIRAAIDRGTVHLIDRAVRDEDLDNARVVFVDTPLEDLGKALAGRPGRPGYLLCVLDRPEHCAFYNPAIVESGGIRLRLSSGGIAPGLLRRMREDLHAAISSPALASFTEKLAEIRNGLPRGTRSRVMQRAVKGFGLRIEFEFPDWFVNDESPPSSDQVRGGDPMP